MRGIGVALLGTAALVAIVRRDRVRAAAGFVAPKRPELAAPAATAGPRCGRWFLAARSDLLMGHGPRSITGRALEHLARELRGPAKSAAPSTRAGSHAQNRRRHDARHPPIPADLDPTDPREKRGFDWLTCNRREPPSRRHILQNQR